MQENILTRVRKLNWVLSESTAGYVSFDELCGIMYDLVDANVYIMSKKGKVLAAKFDKGQDSDAEHKRHKQERLRSSLIFRADLLFLLPVSL